MAAHSFGRRKNTLPASSLLEAAGGALWLQALTGQDGLTILWREARAATTVLGYRAGAPTGMQVVLVPLAAARAADTRIVVFRDGEDPANSWAQLVRDAVALSRLGTYSVGLRLIFNSQRGTAPLLDLTYLPLVQEATYDDFDPVDLGPSDEGQDEEAQPFPRSPSPPLPRGEVFRQNSPKALRHSAHGWEDVEWGTAAQPRAEMGSTSSR